MKIGLRINSFTPFNILVEAVVQWGHANGFETLDLEGNWPPGTSAVIEKYGIHINALGLLPNLLDPDEAQRKANHDAWMAAIEICDSKNVRIISTQLGRDPNKTVADNIKMLPAVFTDIVAYAEQHNVRLAIENCPMMTTWPSGVNIAFSPPIWRELMAMFPSEYFGLTYDVSHLYWMGIDYIAPVKEFGSKIYLVHAKDTEILRDRLKEVGIYGKGWWRYRIPGMGEIDWGRLISALFEVGYDGIISIEHEDPIWEGTEERMKRGIILARQHLERFL